MSKKISTGFAITVIIIIAGFITFAIIKGNEYSSWDDVNFPQSRFENKENGCSKHVYEGEAKIKAWYANNGEDEILNIANEDLKEFPKGLEAKSVKLADSSPEMTKKLKKASEKNPVEITIKGIYSECNKIPLVSFASGEEAFKEYLK